MKEIYKNPTGKNIPHAGFSDVLWIKMTARELKSQTSASRGGWNLGDIGPTFKFIAPSDLPETISHSWEEYESMQSRLAEKVRGAVKIGEEAKGLSNLGKSLGVDSAKKVLDMIKDSDKLGETAINALNNVSVSAPVRAVRVDTPLVYTSSSRRKWDLTFQLVSHDNPAEEVVKPVKQLMRYSSPETTTGLDEASSNIFIKFPWIFDLRTEPGNLIISKYTALTAVQPTWKQPYVKGYPMSCELTLNFIDLSPLFGDLIEMSSKIKTSRV